MKLEVIPWSGPGWPSKNALLHQLVAEGFDAFVWVDAPGATYAAHAHDHDESLWVIEGEITFGIDGRAYRLGPGDRLMLPRGTVHTAHAGPTGAAYLIGEPSARGWLQ